MTCPNSGESIKSDILALIAAIGSYAPTIGKQVMDLLQSRQKGEVFDPTVADYASYAGIDGFVDMAVGQAISNQGRKVVAKLASNQSKIDGAAKNIEQNIDSNSNGGKGTCDDEPVPPPPAPPPPPPIPSSAPPPREGPDGPGGPGGPGLPGGGRPTGGDGPGGPPVRIDPLVIDLNGDGVELTSLTNSNAHFDFGSDSFAEKTGWVAPEDGLLVWDRNSNGTIDNGTELFGNDTIDGFSALAALDTDQNGVFNSNDTAFAQVAVWRDLDCDGTTDAGELASLADVGITSISLNAYDVNQDRSGNWVERGASVSFANGSSSVVENVYFTVDRSSTKYIVPEGFQLSDLASVLPDLKGYGQVRDLSVGATQDPTLANALRALVLDSATMTAAQFRSAVENLVDHWVGTATIDVGDRGMFVNEAHLAVLQTFWGGEFWEQNIGQSRAAQIEDLYSELIDGMAGRLLVQLNTSNFALGVLEGRNVDLLEHPLSAYNVFFYDIETDTIGGRPELFLALATDQLTGDVSAQLNTFESVLSFTPFLSSVLFGGDDTYFDRVLATLVREETNASPSLTNAQVFYAIRNDVHIGSAADDSLTPQSGTVRGMAIYGLDGDDTLMAAGSADVVDGGSGNDTLYGGGGDDWLFGGIGNDALNGGGGNDTYVFNAGDGLDRIDEGESQFNVGGAERIIFGLGVTLDDLIITKPVGDRGDLLIQIAGTTDSILINGQDVSYQGRYYNRIESFVFQTLEVDGSIKQTVVPHSHLQQIRLTRDSTAGDDAIVGSTDADVINGGIGNDSIDGWSGNDTLMGGVGNDTMTGDTGDDTYRFNLGDGQDRIYEGESQFTVGGVERLVFGLGISLSDLIVTKPAADRDDLLIQIAGTTDSMLIDQQDGSYQGRFYDRIESFVFQTEQADGSIVETIVTEAQLQQLRLTQAATAGNDTIIGTTIADVINGGAGNDSIDGWSGNDTLIGGVGNDTLTGGAGNDTYRFNRGDGQDRIYEGESQFEVGGAERLVFGLGITLSDLVVTKPVSNTSDLLIQVRGTNDSILISGQDGSYQGRFYNRIESFVFQTQQADGSIAETVITSAALDDYRLAQSFTEGDDVINGSPNSDELYGAGGNDNINGLAGNDTLIGGVGNDTLTGGTGNDTYRFNLGEGQDRIFEGESQFTVGGAERLVFGLGIALSDLIVTKPAADRNDLLIQITGTTDSILLDQQDGSYQGRFYNRIESFVFQAQQADGSIVQTIVSEAQLQQLRLTQAATSGNDTIIGTTTADVINSGAGNDSIDGWSGNDTLSGGLGNDTLTGSTGNDTYRFNLGDGQDRIFEGESQFEVGGAERLVFGLGITLENLVITKPGTDRNDLLIQIAGSSDSILIDNQDVSYQFRYYNRIESFVFQTQQANGTVTETIVSQAQLQQMRLTQASTAANDTIVGSTDADVINGGSGNDSIDGWSGNDTLIGGVGNDTLTGASGNDTYRFNLGDGQDAIYEGESQFEVGGVERLVFGLGIALSDLIVTKPAADRNDLLIQIAGTTDSIFIDHQDGSYQGRFYNRIESFVFQTQQADGSIVETTVSEAQLQQLRLTQAATAGDDTIVGTPIADVIYGGAGNDRIDGWGGDDTINWSVGHGRDFVDGGASGAAGDRFVLNGDDTVENYAVYARAEAIAAGVTGLNALTEIVITRNGVANVVAELDNVEEITINTAGGDDTVSAVGNFGPTSLFFNTVTVNGGGGRDTIDASQLTSAHRLVLNPGVEGAAEAQGADSGTVAELHDPIIGRWAHAVLVRKSLFDMSDSFDSGLFGSRFVGQHNPMFERIIAVDAIWLDDSQEPNIQNEALHFVAADYLIS